jgi:hypothetical protein
MDSWLFPAPKTVYLYFSDQYYRSCNGRPDVSKKTVKIQFFRAVSYLGTLYTVFLSMEYIFL